MNSRRRSYRLGKRAETRERTRRRILEATISLHDEQGITGTSIRDVASRAAVSAATVLNHFPTLGELVRACGELSDERFPMPTPAVLGGASAPDERLRLAAAALFEWWTAIDRGWDTLQVDRRTLPDVDAWLAGVDDRHRRLIDAALGPDAPDRIVALATALTTIGAWRSLRASGLHPASAAAHVARLIGDAIAMSTRPARSMH